MSSRGRVGVDIYMQWGAIVVGRRNTIPDVHSSVIGGEGNKSAGAYSFIGGGFKNEAMGNSAAVIGGGMM